MNERPRETSPQVPAPEGGKAEETKEQVYERLERLGQKVKEHLKAGGKVFAVDSRIREKGEQEIVKAKRQEGEAPLYLLYAPYEQGKEGWGANYVDRWTDFRFEPADPNAEHHEENPAEKRERGARELKKTLDTVARTLDQARTGLQRAYAVDSSGTPPYGYWADRLLKAHFSEELDVLNFKYDFDTQTLMQALNWVATEMQITTPRRLGETKYEEVIDRINRADEIVEAMKGVLAMFDTE
jgi:hypothetical protein